MSNTQRITVPALVRKKSEGKKIVALTAYDYTMAKLIDRAGVDFILVGDSVGTVVQGQTTTLPVTLDEIVYHCRCVTRGAEHALVVGDMPFMSYQISPERALESAGRLMKDGGVSAVKLEGGVHIAETVARIVDVDIPVMGHVGLTPQSYHRMGGHKKQGRRTSSSAISEAGSRDRVLEDALAVEDAGAFAIVIEGVPADLAAEITSSVGVPTIGIGAGPSCDGQILVTSDMLGMDSSFYPSFVKRYANLSDVIDGAIKSYGSEVRLGQFPEFPRTKKSPDPSHLSLKCV